MISGFLFMGATEEQMALLAGAHVTHVSYILILFSVAFMMFLFVSLLLHLYAAYTWPVGNKSLRLSSENGERTTSRQRLKDAEEFELEGLMSDEDEGQPSSKKVNGHAG